MTSYVMEALENYDPPNVSLISSGKTPTIISADTSAFAYDPVRRKIFYTACVSPSGYSGTLTNNTGFTVWDGTTSTAPAGTITTQNGNWALYFYIAEKSIDTGVVIFHNAYNSANIVPAAIGGDGTTGPGGWRRTVSDVSFSGGNLPNLVDPRTGDFWCSAESCETYLFRAQDNYSLIISPFVPVFNALDLTQIQGLTSSWAFVHEPNHTLAQFDQLYLIPRLITAGEIAADKLLATTTWNYPFHSEAQAGSQNACFRQCFDHSGNMYVVWMILNTTRAYKLSKFVPGTGFSDITPWAGGTGPNTNAAAYTGSGTHTGGPNFQNILLFLPATSNLVHIAKFQNLDDGGSTDPNNTFFDCTYTNLTGSTFDYHHAFVTGYMSAAWTPQTSAAASAYVVLNCLEVDTYASMHDYDFSATFDYVNRWFFFQCNPVVGGVVNTNRYHIVLVKYSFVYGSAPTVVQVIDEAGWDAAYAAYAAQCVATNHVYGTTDANDPNVDVVASSMQAYFGGFSIAFGQWSNPQPTVDAGIFDPTTNAYWWSGQNADMFLLNPAFASRFSGVAQLGNPGNKTPNPPFLRLSFGGSGPSPGSSGNWARSYVGFPR